MMGPVVVSVAANGWGLYREGIYDDSDDEHRDLNHAVVLEGYVKKQKYKKFIL